MKDIARAIATVGIWMLMPILIKVGASIEPANFIFILVFSLLATAIIWLS